MSSVSTSGSGAPKSSFSFGRIWDQYGMLVVFAVLFIACAIFVPNFATFINMKGLGLAISMSGMVACGMLFCLASGDFDLSVASVIACAGVTTAVGLLGTDSATRSPKALLAKTKALNEEGLSVPRDVSVTAYATSYLAQTCRVPLTTISPPQEELGAAAAELLLRIIREGNSNIEGKCVLMEPELVIRESCRREDTDMTQDE